MLALLAALQKQGAESGPASPFEVNFGLFFWTWIVFIALFFALKRYAWPWILKSVEERELLLAKAREEYEALLARVRKDIAAEKEKAIVALRREAVELSIAAASKVIDANLDTDANRRLVTEYLAGLEKEN